MDANELKRLEEVNPIAFYVKMYELNPIDFWRDKIKEKYFSIPEEDRRYCMDMDTKDFQIKKILNL